MKEVILDASISRTYHSHVEVLNNLFGCNYKGHQKATYKLNDSTFVWFPKIVKGKNGEVLANSSGWKNYYTEDFSKVFAEAPTLLSENHINKKITLIFAMLKPQEYVFLGAYNRNVSSDNEKLLVLNRVSSKVKLIGEPVCEVEVLNEQFSNKSYWLFPCNVNNYDVFGAFDKYKEIYWRQHLTRIKKGDYVFIYVGKPFSKLAFLCEVKDVNISNDRTFDIDDSSFEKKSLTECDEYVRLSFIKNLLDKNIHIQMLHEAGLLGNIQSQREISGIMLGKILSKIDSNDYASVDQNVRNDNKILFANVTYMEKYIGEENNTYTGGSFVKKYGFGYEDRNFLNVNGYCYGFVQSNNLKINLKRLNPLCETDTLENVTVIFTAAGPNGRTIIGYYRNAIVYKNMQPSLDQSDKYKDGGYYFKCKYEDAYLISERDRIFKFPKRKKDNFGQYNVWYADNDGAQDIVLSALKFIDESIVVKDSGEIIDPNVSYKSEEGEKKKIVVNVYERDEKLRNLCIKKYGYKCQVCGVCLEDVYGKVAQEFIHVHHIKPISEYGYKHETDALNDLIPVCPNCHAMLHRTKNGSLVSIEELIGILKHSKVRYR